MADVNPYTYIVQNTKGGKVVRITASASEADSLLVPGRRVEVWRRDQKVGTYYSRTRQQLADSKTQGVPKELISRAMRVLDSHRRSLTVQQYRTLKGQVLAGSVDSALRGLEKIKRRASRDNQTR